MKKPYIFAFVALALCGSIICAVPASSLVKSTIAGINASRSSAENGYYSEEEITFEKAESATLYDANRTLDTTVLGSNFSNLKGKTKVSDYIKDTDVWAARPISADSDFVYEAQTLDYPEGWNTELVKISVLGKKTGDVTEDFKRNVKEFEWTSNDLIPLLRLNNSSTRLDALKVTWDYLDSKTAGKDHVWAEMESFMRYQHYAAEYGFDILGCEVGANVPGTNVSVAFTRGAARQYNRGWFVDFSLWGAGGPGRVASMVNYSSYDKAFGGAPINTATAGQGLSATRRHHLYAYMAGAKWIINEAGGNNSFYPELDDDGYYKLSPHGLVFQEVYDFTHRNSERGWNYTPFALVLDYYHGLPYGLWNGTKVFETITPNDGDYMTQNILSLLYPGWNKHTELAANQLINSPYGDVTDVLTQNASQKALNSYPAVILSGDITFTDVEVARYKEYVKQGGILIMNTAYLSQFPEYEKVDGGNKYEVTSGDGKVIVYGADYDITELSGIISELESKFIPFEIEGNVQWMMNVKEGSLVLTIINNDGITKTEGDPEVVDITKTQDVKVKYTGKNSVLEVRNWITGEKIETSATQTIAIAPGDIAIIEFVV